MSKYSCSNSDCTVAITGTCLLSHQPVDTCPNIKSAASAQTQNQSSESPAIVAPLQQMVAVFPGTELGLQQTASIMGSHYGHLIGVLGATGTGKTCLLSSLYLLASVGDLRPRFLFCGSATLPGFENRVRLLRKWNSTHLPEQIVDHTTLIDPRQPGLLNLCLLQTTPLPQVRDFFFTDLPGEWTTDLIKRSQAADRLAFLRRADALLITLPADALLAPETRHSQVQSGRLLLQRLRDMKIDRTIPLILTITRCDKTGPVVPPAIYELIEFGRQVGFENISYLPVAAFSDRPDVPSGLGLGELLDSILQTAPARDLPSHPIADGNARFFLRYSFASESSS